MHAQSFPAEALQMRAAGLLQGTELEPLIGDPDGFAATPEVTPESGMTRANQHGQHCGVRAACGSSK